MEFVWFDQKVMSCCWSRRYITLFFDRRVRVGDQYTIHIRIQLDESAQYSFQFISTIKDDLAWTLTETFLTDILSAGCICPLWTNISTIEGRFNQQSEYIYPSWMKVRSNSIFHVIESSVIDLKNYWTWCHAALALALGSRSATGVYNTW